MIRLDKFLADGGSISRQEAKKKIQQGKVLVDQIPIRDISYKVDSSNEVSFEGNILHYQSAFYYLMNKPKDCVCASTDALHKTIFDYIPMTRKKDLASIGRLDLDTEGLLLVTNDGLFSHYLTSPAHHVEKIYYAQVKNKITQEMIDRFASGEILLDGKKALPAKLVVGKSETECRITVCEGRFHEVKRLFLACDNEVLYLKRLSMGKFALDQDLKPGEYRPFSEKEMEYVREYKSRSV